MKRRELKRKKITAMGNRYVVSASLLVKMVQLRTMAQGHPDYRLIVQEMWRKIDEVHPALAECAKFIDWKSYRLGRLQSEMRTEYKKSALDEEVK